MEADRVYTIYRLGHWIASVRHPEDAAHLIAIHGYGSVQVNGDNTVWIEGMEDSQASDDILHAANVIRKRTNEVFKNA